MWVTWLIDRTNPLTEGHLQRHQNFAPALNGRYLSSNVNITIPGSHGQNVSVPVGGMSTSCSIFWASLIHDLQTVSSNSKPNSTYDDILFIIKLTMR